MGKQRIMLIGAGYMGRAHARVLNKISKDHDISLEIIVDPVKKNAEKIINEYGGIYYPSVNEAFIKEEKIDAAIVSSSTNTHLPILNELLENNVEYILVEKPLGDSLAEAYDIQARYGEERLAKVMVGHIERFNPAFKAFLECFKEGFIGEIITAISRRVGPYTPRITDVGVVLDLAIHDIDLSLSITKKKPHRVYAFAFRKYNEKFEDSALILLDYGRYIHSIEANRITPYKERTMIITGSKGVARIDFIAQELSLFTGKWLMKRNISWTEPLLLEDAFFIEKLMKNERVQPNYMDGLISLELAFKALSAANKDE